MLVSGFSFILYRTKAETNQTPGLWFLQLGTDSESTTATMDIYEREAQLAIDYSGLEEELTVRRRILNIPFSALVQFNIHWANDGLICWQILAEDEEIDAQMEKLKESVSSAEKVLSCTSASNLKALEKKREVKDKLEAVTEGIYLLMFVTFCWSCFP